MFIRILLALPFSLLAALAFCPSAGPEGSGVVVESVAPRSAGDAAGVRPGDVIVSWSCAACSSSSSRPASGGVDSPYDLLPLVIEESPRHAVTLRGKRGEETQAWTLRPGEWGIVARPELPADLAALHRQGQALAEAGDFATAERSWRSAAQAARIAGDGRLAAWFLSRLAEALAKAGKWPEADAAYGEAVAGLEQEPDPRAAAQLLRDWGSTFDRRTGDQYLVQWKPLHSVLSATVYAELATSRPSRPSPGTEPRVALACHGVLAERFPLDSALALTLPGRKAGSQDDLQLQPWKIFESVRLNADLVTLAPCDRAKGPETDEQGLAVLTRALQYAGAPSVLAMLWGVEDGSAAPFLEVFYGHLRGGKSKEEALRAAQIAAIRENTALSHPLHWAAFQLNGDRR